MDVLIRTMHGIGDSLYSRAVIKLLGKPEKLYVETPWPQLYQDLGCHFVMPRANVRGPQRNLQRPFPWSAVPANASRMRLSYAGEDAGPSILTTLLAAARLAPTGSIDFAGPPVNKTNVTPYIVVRPVTIRSEWPSASRNPLPLYINQAVWQLRKHYRIISVADLDDGEWLVGEAPYTDERYHAGELRVERLMQLVANASGLVGGVGWLAPAAVAYKVPLLLIYGGWGYANGPQRIFDSRLDTSFVQNVLPDRFCLCDEREHACDKTITNIEEQIESFILTLQRTRDQ